MRIYLVNLILLVSVISIACSGVEPSGRENAEYDSLQLRIDTETALVSELLNLGQALQADSIITALFNDIATVATPDQILKVTDELAVAKVVTGKLDEVRAMLDHIQPEVVAAANEEYRDRFMARKALVYNEMGESTVAMELLRPIVERYEEEGVTSDFHLMVITTYASILQNLYQYDNTIYWLQRALVVAAEADTSERNIAVIRNNIAVALELSGRYEESLVELEQSYRLNSRNNIVSGITQNLNNMANSLQSLGRTEEAIDTLKAAIRYNQEAGVLGSLVRNYYNLGNILRSSGDFTQAGIYFEKGYETSREINFQFGIMFNASGLARVKNKLNRYEEAYPYAEEALLWARRFENLEIQAEMLEVMASLHEQRNEYRSALQHLRDFKVMSDSLQTLKNQQSIEEVRSRFGFEIVTAENELLKQELLFSEKRDQVRRNMLLSLAAFLLIFAGMYVLILRQNKLIQRKNNYLDDLNRSQENLINIIVHDLRSPLSSLIASLEIIEELTSDKSEEFVEIYQVAEQSAEKLRMMINGLLDIRSIESSDIQGGFLRYNIKKLTALTIENFKSAAAKKKITLETDLDEFDAVTHAEYYNRIVENLVSNALKYSYSNTTVYVKLNLRGNKWALIVTDEGQGFSEKDKSGAFKMFTKLSARPTDNEPSSGLGLYTVRILTERLGGTVTLESEQGKGSTFTCIFPVHKSSG
ncbi:MAG: tetratricopeptide repeat-containing sensor histidine kinase [Bacteroidetes bacterium]|nr:tetratricopeptide repeat-containing sensor histidine kinase [Bacteroidota bacterium]MCH8523305.1 tetratricopeptide repeat-containing sensor histidine kinase [Balneolales bacterium]